MRHARGRGHGMSQGLPAWPTALALSLALALASHATAAQRAQIAHGEYVFHAAGCGACHTQAEGKGPPLAGGRALDTPFGRFYSPNITPHPEHGIGRWTTSELWRALTQGVGPGGVHYYPVFPFPSYAAMRREDSDALYAYLMSVEPQPVPNREHELVWYLRWRFAAQVWQWLFLDTKTFEAVAGKSQQWNRGAYLVRALGHCGECHTPRGRAGELRRDAHLAGNPEGPDGEPVPRIRNDEDGIGAWSESEIATYLESGEDPDFDFAGGAMVDVIEENTSYLTNEDRDAIAVYLKDLPPL